MRVKKNILIIVLILIEILAGPIRPVFYLEDTEIIAGGAGTLADPYILQ